MITAPLFQEYIHCRVRYLPAADDNLYFGTGSGHISSSANIVLPPIESFYRGFPRECALVRLVE
jgi:hypothetical protein